MPGIAEIGPRMIPDFETRLVFFVRSQLVPSLLQDRAREYPSPQRDGHEPEKIGGERGGGSGGEERVSKKADCEETPRYRRFIWSLTSSWPREVD